MIQEIEIFEFDECNEILSKVHDLRSCWISRQIMVPMFTLAAASYLDAVRNSQSDYYSRAMATNRILWNEFQPVYETLSKRLSETLQAPVEFTDRFALPGFHIFEGHPLFGNNVMSVHFDLQYELLDWGKKIENWNPLSFTLPIALPRNGAGLWQWDLFYKEVNGKSQEEKDRIIESRSKSLYEYKTGVLMLHSGQELHQISAMRNFEGGEERVTLQGHGLLVDGVWKLYW